MADLIDQAERNNRDLIILATAPNAAGEKPQASNLLRPADARRVTQSLAPCHGRPTAPPCWKRCGGFRCRDPPIRYGFRMGCPMAPYSRWRRGFSSWGGVEVLMDGRHRLPNLLLPPATEQYEK